MENFKALVNRAMLTPGRASMRPVIEKELLHYDILFALDQSRLLDALTFQGGTCLRLCYGAPRFSEDLDFLGGQDFTTNKLANIKACLENYLGNRYGLEVYVKEPAELQQEPNYRDIKVNKWRITIRTAPEAPDLPSQKIKIEVANLDACTREPRSVRNNYDFLPDGYGDTIVLTESLDEIMADKLISLVNCRSYVRHRDIWDLHWLQKQGAKPAHVYIRRKIEQYSVTDYHELSQAFILKLPDIVNGKDFKDQMTRFLPTEILDRTINLQKFNQLLEQEVSSLLKLSVEY